MSTKSKKSSKPASSDSSKKAPAKKASNKAPTSKEQKLAEAKGSDGRIHASQVESPVKAMLDLCDKMKGERRRDVLAAAEKKGIAFYTARTQYQVWLTASKGKTR